MSPSGQFTQVRISVPARVTSPVRRSRTEPSCSVPVQVWQMPIRQPYGRTAPAFSPATRIAVAPSHSAVMSLPAKVIVPPSPVAAGEQHVLEGLHVQPFRDAGGLEVGPERVQHRAGAAGVGFAFPPVRADLVEGLGLQAAVLAGRALRDLVAGHAVRRAPTRSAAKIASDRVRAE